MPKYATLAFVMMIIPAIFMYALLTYGGYWYYKSETKRLGKKAFSKNLLIGLIYFFVIFIVFVLAWKYISFFPMLVLYILLVISLPFVRIIYWWNKSKKDRLTGG
jgi:hypothetical protein